MEDNSKVLYNKNHYHRFDFYKTPLDFVYYDNGEDTLKYSDYGITRNDINSYIAIIEKERERIEYKEKVFSNRLNVACVLFGIFECIFFWWSIGYFNDFMKDIELFINIILYPCYGIYIYFLIKIAYPYGVFIMSSVKESLLQMEKCPNHVLHEEHINKYFDDLLWVIYHKKKH